VDGSNVNVSERRQFQELWGLSKVFLLLHEYRDPPFVFQNLNALQMSSQQVKFERKFIASAISMELP